jgi:hypothetical protein
MNTEEIFNSVYNGQGNFITPDVERFGEVSDDLVYELSSGRGIFNSARIFGVTVLRLVDGEWTKQPDLSNGGFSLAAAEEYIEELKEAA